MTPDPVDGSIKLRIRTPDEATTYNTNAHHYITLNKENGVVGVTYHCQSLINSIKNGKVLVLFRLPHYNLNSDQWDEIHYWLKSHKDKILELIYNKVDTWGNDAMLSWLRKEFKYVLWPKMEGRQWDPSELNLPVPF